MSLNWNLSKIANKDTVCFTTTPDGERQLRGLTERLIWTTMSVSLGEITAKNVEEWVFRLHCVGRVYGDDSLTTITRDQIAQHIGLTTNVFPNKTRKQFLARMGEVLERVVREDIESLTEKAAA
jgi:hypothetical protein